MAALRSSLALLVCLASAVVGCADEGPTSAESQDITVREGYHQLREGDQGAVYQGIAAIGSTAFLAKGSEGVHTVDLGRMEVTGGFTTGRNERRLYAEGVVTAGDELLVYAQHDERPLDPFGTEPYARAFVMTFLDAETGEPTQEIAIDIAATLTKGLNSPFIQLPSMSAAYDADTDQIAVTFSHISKPGRLYVFDRPEGDQRIDFEEVLPDVWEGVDLVKGAAFHEGGLLLARGPEGLARIELESGEWRTIAKEDAGWAVGVATDGALAYVADHDGALTVIDIDRGALVADREIPDWVEGVTLLGRHVLVGARNGLFVSARPR
jgi:hypothetical protein